MLQIDKDYCATGRENNKFVSNMRSSIIIIIIILMTDSTEFFLCVSNAIKNTMRIFKVYYCVLSCKFVYKRNFIFKKIIIQCLVNRSHNSVVFISLYHVTFRWTDISSIKLTIPAIKNKFYSFRHERDSISFPPSFYFLDSLSPLLWIRFWIVQRHCLFFSPFLFVFFSKVSRSFSFFFLRRKQL